MPAHPTSSPTRRELLKRLSVLVPVALGSGAGSAQPAPAVARRPIPSSGEALPVVGLGSWITFNVGNDRAARDDLMEAMDGIGHLPIGSQRIGAP